MSTWAESMQVREQREIAEMRQRLEAEAEARWQRASARDREKASAPARYVRHGPQGSRGELRRHLASSG